MKKPTKKKVPRSRTQRKTPKKRAAKRSAAKKTLTKESIPEQSIPEQSIPEQSIPEQSIPEQDVPEQSIPEQSIPEQSIPEQSVPEQSVPEQSIPEENVSEQVFFEESIPEENLSEQVLFEQSIVEQGAPIQQGAPQYSTHQQSVPAEEPDLRPENFLLRTEDLRKVYDGRAVVKDVAITVRPGEIVGLLGPNGAGKTTSFYMIVGLVPPNGGKVYFNQQDVTTLPMYQRARLGMGYLPQEESIFRKLTVRENIMAVMETMNLSRRERKERCDNLLEHFGIAHVANNIALTLSGGEKRRLTIARSLVTEPQLLMLDEPFSGVDPIAVGEIQDIITKLKDVGLAILITDHNVRETLAIVDRAYLIFEGSVEREGTQDFLVNDPVSRELYLGERFSM